MRKLIIILAGILALFVFIRDIKVADNANPEHSDQKAELSIQFR